MKPTAETLRGLADAAPNVETYKLILRLAHYYGIDLVEIVIGDEKHP
jgi:hypothetical protein